MPNQCSKCQACRIPKSKTLRRCVSLVHKRSLPLILRSRGVDKSEPCSSGLGWGCASRPLCTQLLAWTPITPLSHPIPIPQIAYAKPYAPLTRTLCARAFRCIIFTKNAYLRDIHFARRTRTLRDPEHRCTKPKTVQVTYANPYAPLTRTLRSPPPHCTTKRMHAR